jgi:(1->4)-alpha-D-glucan 1-alpha-D-glucosylmutase
MAEPDPLEPPRRVGTYRWQLTPTEGFEAAADAVPDLAALGVSHLYLSPLAEAVPGSLHGYDVTDPTRVRAELGGPEGLARLVDACRAAGLALLVDIVPNHLAAHARNPWWWDVLRHGPASRHAELFDIDWGSTGTVLLPVLGDHYGRELEAGALQLARGEDPARVLVLRAAERTFPLCPEAEGAILAEVARVVGDDVLGVAARLLARADDTTRPDERDADLAVAERTALARLGDPATSAALDAELARLNADVEALDLVIGRQHYRLARWTVGDAELDYRRFFDVDALVATNMQGASTFDVLHGLPAELLAADAVDGLRVDHVDGLADPGAYLRRLRGLAGPARWLLVEKIVRGDEELPADWPVDGTTGYEVADLLGAWLTDPRGAEALQQAWAARTGEDRTYAEVALEARREVLRAGFAADLERVVDAVQAVCQHLRRHRDHARRALRAAVLELAVHLPVYRTYVPPDGSAPAGATDRALLDGAAAAARAAAPHLDHELFDLLTDVLTGRLVGEAESLVVTRFQQLTGPVAAKGEEDTALYRWLPLPHRCEVGADPGRTTLGAEDWHAACTQAQTRHPQRLTTLSTHDTKRSADARARLAALTATPDRLVDAFDRWWGGLATPASSGAVDVGTGWLAFHVLVAGWPMDLDRAWAVVEKSVREAGTATSWTAPDEAFEAALRGLVERAVQEPALRDLVHALVDGTAEAADAAALAQLLAQLLAPGVPDVYQGGERWDRSLVDPDNRRPPDPAQRHRLARAALAADPVEAWADLEQRASGLPRTVVLQRALAARRRHPDATGPTAAGAYVPLTATGPDADRVLAFGRGDPAELAVVVVRPAPPAPSGDGATGADAEVTLPEGEWSNVFTGTSFRGEVAVSKLLHGFPVALLER